MAGPQCRLRNIGPANECLDPAQQGRALAVTTLLSPSNRIVILTSTACVPAGPREVVADAVAQLASLATAPCQHAAIL